MIRVVLADDQRLFREALALLLSVQDDVQVVGEAGDGAQAVELVRRLEPDVVLMDLRMPVMDGATATRRLRDERPGVRVIALTTFDDEADVFAAIRAGAIGYLLKDASSETLMEAVRAAVRGESVLEPGVAAKLVSQVASTVPPVPVQLAVPLTGRELDVLRLVAGGRSNREIAAQLFLAEGTVKNHVTSALVKLEVRDRTQAALRARELGLL